MAFFGMALVTTLFAFLAVFAILFAIGFIGGTILFGFGIINRIRPSNKGKKYPTVCICFGAILIAVPFLALTIATLPAMTRPRYDSVPEQWKHYQVYESKASRDALNALLTSAGEGDRDSFVKNFSDEVQKSSSFSSDVTLFFQNYPTALSQCKPEGNVSSDRKTNSYGHDVFFGSGEYTCDLDGERYYITMKFCYHNPDEPDLVGVQSFTVMDLRARALYLQNKKQKLPAADDSIPAVSCQVFSKEEVNARLVAGNPMIWKDVPNKKLPEKNMETVLWGTDTIEALQELIGEANAVKHPVEDGDWFYYYELQPENDEPRYVEVIVAPTGKIRLSNVCTPKSTCGTMYSYPF